MTTPVAHEPKEKEREVVTMRMRLTMPFAAALFAVMTALAISPTASQATVTTERASSIEDTTWRLAPPSAGDRKFVRLYARTTVRTAGLGIREAEGRNFVQGLQGPLKPGGYVFRAAPADGCDTMILPSFDLAVSMEGGAWSWSRNRFRTYTAQCLDNIRRSAGVTCPTNAAKTFMVTARLDSGEYLAERAVWYRLRLASGKSLVSRGQKVADNTYEFHFTAPARGTQPSVSGMKHSWGVFRQSDPAAPVEVTLKGDCLEA